MFRGQGGFGSSGSSASYDSFFDHADHSDYSDDEVFHPNNSIGSNLAAANLATSGVPYGQGVSGFHSMVIGLDPRVRERIALGLPQTARDVAPYEVNVPNGRVFVSPLRAIEPAPLHGTVVTTPMHSPYSYF